MEVREYARSETLLGTEQFYVNACSTVRNSAKHSQSHYIIKWLPLQNPMAFLVPSLTQELPTRSETLQAQIPPIAAPSRALSTCLQRLCTLLATGGLEASSGRFPAIIQPSILLFFSLGLPCASTHSWLRELWAQTTPNGETLHNRIISLMAPLQQLLKSGLETCMPRLLQWDAVKNTMIILVISCAQLFKAGLVPPSTDSFTGGTLQNHVRFSLCLPAGDSTLNHATKNMLCCAIRNLTVPYHTMPYHTIL